MVYLLTKSMTGTWPTLVMSFSWLLLTSYEELTVRENLTLAAQMRLSKTLSLSEKLDHVEKVMKEVLGTLCMICHGM